MRRSSVLRPPENYDIDVQRRVKIYRLILYSQIIATVLMVIGFIIFLLLLARVIQI